MTVGGEQFSQCNPSTQKKIKKNKGGVSGVTADLIVAAGVLVTGNFCRNCRRLSAGNLVLQKQI
jgi:hypothetical protein